MSDYSEQRRVTIVEVAKLAGVSLGTASRVLNGNDRVHHLLSERVQLAAKELGYEPHPLAQALRRGRSRTIGFCVPLISSPAVAAALQSASRFSYEAGYTLTISATEYDPVRERSEVESFVRQRVAALVCFNVSADAKPYLLAQQAGVQVVFARHRPPGIEADLVAQDHYGGTLAAVRHLIGRGRRRLAMLIESPVMASNVARLKAYHDGYAQAGLPVPQGLIRDGLFVEEEAYAAVQDLLVLPDPPDAVIACTGLLVPGALACLRDRDVRIPDEIALVGSDLGLWGRLTDPPLTMIETDAREMGRQSVRLILERLDPSLNLPKSREIYIPTRLIVRSSS